MNGARKTAEEEDVGREVANRDGISMGSQVDPVVMEDAGDEVSSDESDEGSRGGDGCRPSGRVVAGSAPMAPTDYEAGRR